MLHSVYREGSFSFLGNLVPPGPQLAGLPRTGELWR
jgi:hypothetical protein